MKNSTVRIINADPICPEIFTETLPPIGFIRLHNARNYSQTGAAGHIY